MAANPAKRLLSRMVLVALVIGTSVTVSATERVTLSLVLAGGIGWSFVPVLQALTGLLLIRGVDRRPRLELLDRYFATGWLWNLWIVAIHVTLLVWPAGRRLGILVIGAAAAVPIIGTLRLLLRYSQTELGFDAHGARVRVLQHQAVTYALVLAYVSFAVSLWPRVIGLFA
jgi:hypothetical protein